MDMGKVAYGTWGSTPNAVKGEGSLPDTEGSGDTIIPDEETEAQQPAKADRNQMRGEGTRSLQVVLGGFKGWALEEGGRTGAGLL